jgi:fused signal recognition particle receptor
MFEGLKKRLSNFMDSVVSKEKAEIKKEEEEQTQAAETIKENTEEQIKEHRGAHAAEEHAIRQESPAQSNEEKDTGTETVHERSKTEEHHNKPDQAANKTYKVEIKAQQSHKEEDKEKHAAPPEVHHPAYKHDEIKVQEKHHEKKPTVGTATKIKGIFIRNMHLKEGDIDPFISALKIGLLESDVNYDVVEKLTDEIRKDMLSRSISSRGLDNEIRQIIRESIQKILAKRSGSDLLEVAKEKKTAHELPLKILFIGPNGAGKTTTMAKIANMFITNGFTCVMSASDTFRAAAIEQTTFHADKLGIRVVKGAYGSDPASIAFDAIAHAKAHNVDVVLMDSAGRQETNKSLVEELKKIARVTKPDLKIFIGESIAGNSLLDQVKALNEAVSIDGIILTKLDCDAKGGNTISLLSELSIPILFFGIGEKYNDLMPYDPDFIIDNILPNN